MRVDFGGRRAKGTWTPKSSAGFSAVFLLFLKDPAVPRQLAIPSLWFRSSLPPPLGSCRLPRHTFAPRLLPTHSLRRLFPLVFDSTDAFILLRQFVFFFNYSLSLRTLLLRSATRQSPGVIERDSSLLPPSPHTFPTPWCLITSWYF